MGLLIQDYGIAIHEGMASMKAENLLQLIRDERREAVLIVLGEIGEEVPMTKAEAMKFLEISSTDTYAKYMSQRANPLPFVGKGKMVRHYKSELRDWLRRQKNV